MQTFKIQFQEVLSRTVEVRATNIEDAIAIANQMYKSEEVVLDYSDLLSTEIIPIVEK